MTPDGTIVAWVPGHHLFQITSGTRRIVVAYAPGSRIGKYVANEALGQYIAGEPPSLDRMRRAVAAGNAVELEEDNPGFYSHPLEVKQPAQPPAPPPRVFHPANNPRARVEWHHDGTCFIDGPSASHQQSWAYTIEKLEHFVECGTWCEILPVDSNAPPRKSADIPSTRFEEAW